MKARSRMRPWGGKGIVAAVGLGLAAAVWLRPDSLSATLSVGTWKSAASPGDLSAAHRFLDGDCEACHTPVVGVAASNCVVCHANEASLLQRQPTAFHADIGVCRECHVEHQGLAQRPTVMDHSFLARFGLRQLAQDADPESEDRVAYARLARFLTDAPERSGLVNESLAPHEMILECAECHQNDDRHFDFFGTNCASCHGVTAWTIPEFRHPASTSLDCAQCHQAPPSHYMMHFKMISQRVAGQPHADVEQCHLCHQTTSWPDIKGAGWYKHH